MSISETPGLAGSAPSEQELLETLAEAIGEFERLAAEEPAKFRPANLLTAHQLRWLASNIGGLLARARDGERMAALDEALDDFRWQHIRADGETKTVAVLDWFFGDGDSAATTSGATIREAVDAFLELMAANQRDESAAARSTGSVDNG